MKIKISPKFLYIFLILPLFFINGYQKIGLALSGGVGRGLAHIGVLKVLEKNGIYPDMIAGTSMGSIVGGLYSCGYSAEELEQITLNINWASVFSDKLPEEYLPLEERKKSYLYPLRFRHNYFNFNIPQSIVGGENILLTLEKLTADASWEANFDFDSLPIPFRAVAADVKTGDKIILKKGRLSKALRASSSIPGVFDPVEIDGRYLIDGGVVDNLPVSVLKEEGCDFIIAVDVGLHLPQMGLSAIEVIVNGVTALSRKNREKSRKEADIFIAPYLKDYSLVDFYEADKMIKQGEIAAEAKIDEIKKYITPEPEREIKKKTRKKMIVATVEIEGLKNTRKWMIEQFIKIHPGDTLNPDKIYNDLVTLYRTDIFRKVDYEIKNLEGTGVELKYKVEERPTGTIGFGVNYYYPDELSLLIGIHQGNIFGLGLNIEGNIGIGWLTYQDFSFGSYNLLGFPFGFKAEITNKRQLRNTYYSHKWNYSFKENHTTYGFQIGLTPKKGNLTIGYKNSSYRYVFPSFIKEIPSSIRRNSLTAKFEYTTFDKLFLPSHGFTIITKGDLYIDSILYNQDFSSFDYSKLKGKVEISFENTLSFKRFSLDTEIKIASTLPYDRTYHFSENHYYTGRLGYYQDEIFSNQILFIATGPRVRTFKIFSSPIFLYIDTGTYITNFSDFSQLTENSSPGIETGFKFNSPMGNFKVGVGFSKYKTFLFYLQVG